MTVLYKISVIGVIGDTPEQFVYHHWIEDLSGTTTVEEAADAMEGSVASMLDQTIASSSPAATLGDLFPDTVAWTELQARAWDPLTDKQIGSPASRVLTLAGAGAGAFAFTNQTAFAVSVRTGTTGRRRWNRFYLPPMITTAREAGDNVYLSVAQALSDWLVALNNTLRTGSPAFHYVKYSPAAHATALLDSTYIGTRFDTQRRRANQEVEVRVQDPFVYS